MGANQIRPPEGFILDNEPPTGFVLDTKPPEGFILDSQIKMDKAGANLPFMPQEGPAQKPLAMDQMKVYGMLEGMPAALAEGIKKTALEYDIGREYGEISMPELSLPKTLWTAFKNIPDSLKDVIKETYVD